MTLSSVRTPRVFIDADRVHRNIARMAELAASAGVRLRPHTKTHKSPVIARWQLDAGAVGVCCAKVGEAEVFADAGIEDIRLPYPVHFSNADRLSRPPRARDGGSSSTILGVARGWSRAMAERTRARGAGQD